MLGSMRAPTLLKRRMKCEGALRLEEKEEKEEHEVSLIDTQRKSEENRNKIKIK